MREITTHKLPGLNESINLTAIDEPGQGGANHIYEIEYAESRFGGKRRTVIKFQNGPVAEFGPNGISNEVPICLVADRLESFQAGEFACEDNADALQSLRNALTSLQRRTKERMQREVEGTNQK